MRITSLDGDSIELRIVGYQFPDSGFSPGDQDANWLVVSPRRRASGSAIWPISRRDELSIRPVNAE